MLTQLPLRYKVITCKWVFWLKINANSTKWYKTWLVIWGYKKCKGIDYKETFTPVIMLKMIRVLLTLVILHDWEIDHMDVKAAFLNLLLNEIIYMTQPEGFAFGDYVCHLRNALYGLKQAPWVWYQDIDKFLKTLGFTSSTSDSNLYISQDIILSTMGCGNLLDFQLAQTRGRSMHC